MYAIRSYYVTHFFRDLGVNVRYYLPERMAEGYGLNEDAVRKIRGTRPERMREIAAMDDIEKLVATFAERRIQIGEGRMDLPHSSPALMFV